MKSGLNHLRCVGVVLGLLLCVAACDGCGSSRVKVIDNYDAADVDAGDRVRVDGTLSMRGSTPFTILVLENSDSSIVTVNSDDDALMTELRSMVGLACGVEGRVVTPLTGNAGRISATSYQLLPLPSGELPMVGILEIENGECVLVDKQGKRYWIRGQLVAAIRQYLGARIWVVGERTDTDASDRPKKSTPFTPTGYGVLDEAPAP
jgi:hypothetical protein